MASRSCRQTQAGPGIAPHCHCCSLCLSHCSSSSRLRRLCSLCSTLVYPVRNPSRRRRSSHRPSLSSRRCPFCLCHCRCRRRFCRHCLPPPPPPPHGLGCRGDATAAAAATSASALSGAAIAVSPPAPGRDRVGNSRGGTHRCRRKRRMGAIEKEGARTAQSTTMAATEAAAAGGASSLSLSSNATPRDARFTPALRRNEEGRVGSRTAGYCLGFPATLFLVTTPPPPVRRHRRIPALGRDPVVETSPRYQVIN
jgi:hypothetical protein